MKHTRAPRGVRLPALALCVLLACSGCGPQRPSLATPAPRPTPRTVWPTLPQTMGVIRRYFEDVRAGSRSAAYALWAPGWQRLHPGGTAIVPPGTTPGVDFLSMVPRAGGVVDVAVRVAQRGPLVTHWTTATFQVGLVAGAPRLVSGRVRAPTPLIDLQAQARTDTAGTQRGSAVCGGYRIRWRVVPAPAENLSAGAQTTVRIDGPDDRPVPAVPIPPFAFGTYPTYCGDLLGNGGVDLMLNTALTSNGWYREATVIGLSEHGTRLLAQIPTQGGLRLPRPSSVDGLYPYEIIGARMVDDFGQPILGPRIWAFSGRWFVPATKAFPAFLRRNLAKQLTTLRMAERDCTQQSHQWPPCDATQIARAYYDYLELGEAEAGLHTLAGLLPASEGSWLQQQSQIIAERSALP